MSNVQYPSQVITLVDGILVGFHKVPDAESQRWVIISVGGDKVTFQNPFTGIYARVESEHQYARVVGGPNPYVFQLLIGPDGKFRIVTEDGEFVWRLTAPDDYAPIELQKTPYDGRDAQWNLESLARAQ